MDELLFDRVKQLKEIDDHLGRIARMPSDKMRLALEYLRYDLALMIAKAEQEHAGF